MADEVDLATALADAQLARSIAAARVPVPDGEPGECESCFEDIKRLVGGRCARCRDRLARRMG